MKSQPSILSFSGTTKKVKVPLLFVRIAIKKNILRSRAVLQEQAHILTVLKQIALHLWMCLWQKRIKKKNVKWTYNANILFWRLGLSNLNADLWCEIWRLYIEITALLCCQSLTNFWYTRYKCSTGTTTVDINKNLCVSKCCPRQFSLLYLFMKLVQLKVH